MPYYYLNNNNEVVEMGYINLPSDFAQNLRYVKLNNINEAILYFEAVKKIYDYVENCETETKVRFNHTYHSDLKLSILITLNLI